MFPFFPLPAKVSFQRVFRAQRLMTTCFPTDMFNQRLIRGGTDTFSSADLIFHFAFWCPTFINLQSGGEEKAPKPSLCFMNVAGCLFALSCFVASARKGQSLQRLWMLPFPHLPFFVCPLLKGDGSPRDRLTGAFNNWLTFMFVPAFIKENTGREEEKHWWSSLPPALN